MMRVYILITRASMASSRRTAAGDFDGYDTFNTMSLITKIRRKEEAFKIMIAARSSLGTAIRRMKFK